MLKLHNIHKDIAGKSILKDINLEVKKGEILAIIGPSGAGKSTLLRSINLLERPQKGQITIDGLSFEYANLRNKDILTLRQKSAMVFQHYNLFKNKNVLENVAEGLIVVKKIPKNKAYEIAKEQLERVGLKDKQKSYVWQLSGGQAQRVGIARALALDVDLLLFDEPTSALDPELVGEVLEVIKEIKDKTLLLVTHELNFAKNVADEIIFMENGMILQQSSTKEFFDNIKFARVGEFLSKFGFYNEEFVI